MLCFCKHCLVKIKLDISFWIWAKRNRVFLEAAVRAVGAAAGVLLDAVLHLATTLSLRNLRVGSSVHTARSSTGLCTQIACDRPFMNGTHAFWLVLLLVTLRDCWNTAEKMLCITVPLLTSTETACSQSLFTEQESKLYPDLWWRMVLKDSAMQKNVSHAA